MKKRKQVNGCLDVLLWKQTHKQFDYQIVEQLRGDITEWLSGEIVEHLRGELRCNLDVQLKNKL